MASPGSPVGQGIPFARRPGSSVWWASQHSPQSSAHQPQHFYHPDQHAETGTLASALSLSPSGFSFPSGMPVWAMVCRQQQHEQQQEHHHHRHQQPQQRQCDHQPPRLTSLGLGLGEGFGFGGVDGQDATEHCHPRFQDGCGNGDDDDDDEAGAGMDIRQDGVVMEQQQYCQVAASSSPGSLSLSSSPEHGGLVERHHASPTAKASPPPPLAPPDEMASIIAFDCLGAEWYKSRRLPYATPLVGSLFRCVLEFLRFCSNLPLYLSVPPMACPAPTHPYWNGVWYPVTLHNDVEIHWIHETSVETVLEKWHRRVQRVNWNRITVVFADAWIPPDVDEAVVLSLFEQLPWPRKVVYTRRVWDPARFPSALFVKRWEGASLGDYGHNSHCHWYDRLHVLEHESQTPSVVWSAAQ